MRDTNNPSLEEKHKTITKAMMNALIYNRKGKPGEIINAMSLEDRRILSKMTSEDVLKMRFIGI